MKNFKNTIALTMLVAFGVGCSAQQREYTDIERANEFVKELNYLGNSKYSSQHKMVKAVSMYKEGDSHYIVVLDDSLGRENYFAVDIRQWIVGRDADSFLNDQTRQNRAYFNLRSNLNGTFTYINRDGSEGPTFSASKTANVDVRRSRAAVEEARKEIIADNLVRMGFRNRTKALSAAKHVYQLSAVMSKRELTQADLDSATLAAFNVPMSDAAKAVVEGDVEAVNEFSTMAFKAGVGTSPESAQDIITNIVLGL